MNNFEIHDAATDLAAGRTAYSLAREVLGLRAQVAELRREREENIGTLAAQDAILGIIRNRLGVPAAPLRKPQGEKLLEALSRQSAELARLREFDKGMRPEGHRPAHKALPLANPPRAK